MKILLPGLSLTLALLWHAVQPASFDLLIRLVAA
jgi:hypothetical protein